MKTLIFRSLAIAALLLTLGTTSLLAQTTASRIALRVSQLTPDERDALNRDLIARGELRITYACVPAGIIIIEPVGQDRDADSVRAMAAAAIIRRLPADRRMEIPLTLTEAEALCSAARNQ